jgi:hypothetical protein
MTIAAWCVLAAAIMPVLLAGVAKAGSRYDNARPRDFESQLEGYRRRAYAAHQNCFEAFPWFAAAVLFAQTGGAAQGRTDMLAFAFIVLRLAYAAAYLADRPTLRSGLWTAAFGCAVAIFLGPLGL